MSEQLKPMDIYSSDMSIPFNVAAYCRGHKYSVEAVNLARAIQRRRDAAAALVVAERVFGAADSGYGSALEAILAKMERDPL